MPIHSLQLLILFNLDYLEFRFFYKERNLLIDIFIQELATIEFEAFEEEKELLKAFVAKNNFSKTKFQLLASKYKHLYNSYKEISHPFQNWNKKWESNFEIININQFCSIRASFHLPTNKKYDIIINPKMSFGTGHHETTRLMAKELFNYELSNKSILDFGSGTAILSIISEKLGAVNIDAIEINERVNKNALENIKLNKASQINVITGTGKNIPDKKYDFILININKNTIINEFNFFLNSTKSDSVLILSGFLYSDVNYISKYLKKHNLKIINSNMENNWAILIVKFT